MKFNLLTVKDYYTDPDEISRLKSIGFKFKVIRKEKRLMNNRLNDVTEYEITNEPIVEFKSVFDIVLFVKKHGDIIINKRGDFIELYNGRIY